MIIKDLKALQLKALKERDTLRVSVLRYLISAINNKEIALRSQKMTLEDKHILKTIQKQIKQRKDSIESYKEGGRVDLVEKEEKELAILEELYKTFGTDE